MEEAIAEMRRVGRTDPGVLKQLSYVTNPSTKFGTAGSNFGGYPSLSEREASFKIKESMQVYCGYVLMPLCPDVC